MARSFTNAFAGLWAVWRSQRNARIEVGIALAVVVAGLVLRLPARDWAILVLTIGLVLAAECFNSAVEALVDLAHPGYHALAKLAKDVSAGAVLLLSVMSVIIGLLVLGPPLL
ncbi:MAG: diacylglycerol kinase family protein, partial [Anaerolineae bacterium]|nr:diacylglycerol kinase family protein [Anaerolineae bacterium]